MKAATTNEIVTVEIMPQYLRESHRAAHNWGTYPHNGAVRERVSREEAEEIVESDPDGYAHIVSTHPKSHAQLAREIKEALAAPRTRVIQPHRGSDTRPRARKKGANLTAYRSLVEKAIARCSKHPRPNHSLYECVFEEVNGGAPYPTPQMRRILEDAVHAARPASNLHAKRKKLDPHEAKQRLQAAGINFSRDFHTLPSGQVDLILDMARAAGYRKRKDAPGSTARMYFQYLTKSPNNLHAKKKRLDHYEAKQRLKAAGVDFSRAFHTLPSNQADLILDMARAAGYRKRKDVSGTDAEWYFKYLKGAFDAP